MSSSDKQKKSDKFFNLCCGGVSGVLSRTAVSPLERLKILYQVQYVTLEAGGARKYNGVLDSLKIVHKEEGIRGFYKGNGSNAIRVFPYIGIQFTSYSYYSEFVNDYLNRPAQTNLLPLEKLFTGAVAGMTSVICTYPLDIIRGRLSAQGGAVKQQYTGMLDCFTQILKQEGPKGIYSGISPTLIGIGPYVGINFLVYETLKEKAPIPEGQTSPSAGYLALCGAVAGTTGQSVAYPLDLLRRRFQMQNLEGSKVQYKSGVLSAVKQIITQEGLSGLYKGYLPNFIKTWPTIAIMFWANDMLKQNTVLRSAFGLE